jgi:hypothetical protein
MSEALSFFVTCPINTFSDSQPFSMYSGNVGALHLVSALELGVESPAQPGNVGPKYRLQCKGRVLLLIAFAGQMQLEWSVSAIAWVSNSSFYYVQWKPLNVITWN